MNTQNHKNISIALLSFALGALITYSVLVYAGFNKTTPMPQQNMTAPPSTPASTPQTQQNQIHITTPEESAVITSPLTIEGDAPGTWFFEGSFPITLVDRDGHLVAESHAEAIGNWMTTNTVPFKASLTFTARPEVKKGYIIFKKDNPSGLPENDGEYRLPVTF